MLGIVRSLGSWVAAIVDLLWRVVATILRLLFGEVRWQAPGWLTAINNGARAAGAALTANSGRATTIGIGLLAVGAAAVGGWWWMEQQPKPRSVSYVVTNPPRTALERDQTAPQPLVVKFTDSVAPLALVGKPITAGIALSPALEGAWQWEEDRVLRFTPAKEWPIGQSYTVRIDRTALAEQVRLANYRFTFHSAPFEAKLTESQFFLDPQDPTLRKVIATVNFSHPVDSTEFERRIVLRQKGQSVGFLGLGGQSTKFKVSYDKLKLNAYVHSESIPIPTKETFADLTIDPGIRAARGGPATADPITATITIPGRYSLLVTNVVASSADNERLEPDRILLVTLNNDTPEREVNKAVSAWVLPEHHPDTPPEQRKNPANWSDPTKIDPRILATGNVLKLTPVAAERDNVAQHGFKFDADAGRYVYIKVTKGVKSFNGYEQEKDFDRIVRIERFPQQLRIIGTGSLVALSGERKLAVLARDVPAIRFEIGRVLPSQLHHLASQSTGAFTAPNFNSPFEDSAIVERFVQIREIPDRRPGKPSYHALDLGQYLDAESRRGVFFIKAEGYDPATKAVTNIRDQRLVVVSDLGLLAKRAGDSSHDVFVQSIHTGQPVAGAAVELVGKNGVTLLSGPTDATGRVRLGQTNAFTRERQPSLIIARRGNDTAFLPIINNSNDRLVDVSRFDVGGVDAPKDAGQLSAYIFSDRGLYRPGEEIRFGMIVRAADWGKRIAGLPLELELTDTRGIAIRRERIKLAADGFLELRQATADIAPTGTYTLSLYTVKDGQPDASIGQQTVEVQEFEPDRLKMDVRMSTESPLGWVSPDQLKARVNLQNLFGTAAASRRIAAQLTLAPQFPAFPAYREYRFFDPQVAKTGVTEELTESKTNERGEAELDLGLQRFARATYLATVVAQGFEADGGRGVTAGATQLVSNMPYLVGYRADGDLGFVSQNAQRTAELIAIDPQARKIDVKDLTLVRIDRRFVSVLTQQSNGTYKYESRRKEVELDRRPIAITQAGAALALDTAAPGAFAYLVRDSAGLDLARVEYGVAGAANLTRSLEKNAELQVTLNRRDYQGGEEIELAIVAPYTGAGLLTIERDRVYEHVWFKAATTASTQRIRIPKDLEGNAYVSVAFVRDPGSEEIYTSPLSYSVQPFSIALDRRKTTITVEAPTLVKPGEVLRIKHRADRPARAVIFAIDEGILQVARYARPDPLAHFFQKQALGVQTVQILDLILPEFKRLMQSAAPGGGDDATLGSNLNPFKRRRDPPVAYWSGVIETGPQGGELTYTVPENFNGSLRVMAVVVSDEALGATAEKSTVRGDFVISPNLPATVTPGDEFEISVGVSNNVAGSGNDAKVALALALSNHFEMVGSPKIELAIGEARESSAIFKLRTKDVLGAGSVGFTASLGPKSAKNSTEISVRPANPYVTTLAVGSVRDGRVEVATARDLYENYRRLESTVSHLPVSLSHALANYLRVYPYSCTEQLVSQAMPVLILGNRPEFAAAGSGPIALASAASVGLLNPQTSLPSIVGMLRTRQNGEGGYGLWAANHYVEEWVSVYAHHFLIEARERGQTVPSDLLNFGNDYLRTLVGTDGDSLAAERTRAYAVYLLTRQGIVTSNFAAGVQKRLETNHAQTWRSDLSAALLAASYQLMKQDRVAERLIADVPFGTARRYADYYDTLTHDAQLLYLTARHFPARAKSLPAGAIEGIMKSVSAGDYHTLSSAYVILAFDAYAAVVGSDANTKLAVAEILKNGSKRAVALPAGLFAKAPYTPEAAKLEISAQGSIPGFYAVTQSGFDRAPPAREIKAGVEILREYVNRDGKPVTNVKLGDEVTVRLRFRALDRDQVTDVAMVDLLPGGFELVLESRDKPAPGQQRDPGTWQPSFGTSLSDWTPNYADMREDRVVLYGTVERDAKQFVYRIRATNVGSFAVPPAYAESMYERAVRAQSLGSRIAVERK